jgi:hypothetical protein
VLSEGGGVVSEPFLQTVGLREAVKMIKRLERKDIIKDLKQTNARLSDMVIDKARATASTPQERAAASKALVAVRGERPGVRMARNKFPGVVGAEFGAYFNRPRTGHRGRQFKNGGTMLGWNQFVESKGGAHKPWTPPGPKAGYFVWPAIRANSQQLAEMYAEEISRLLGSL